ncbi:MAG TPA: hypothetical protein VEW07_04095 [Solirubrobacterales bacterium]|nr:hypothetical protein [Solirubrobacterales bacterium]
MGARATPSPAGERKAASRSTGKSAVIRASKHSDERIDVQNIRGPSRRPRETYPPGPGTFPVTWRILLTALYTAALGALAALENFNPGMSDVPLLAAWLAAPVVGFAVGRWWVLFAVVGALVGRTIGWDPAENDGNPALWPPYVVMTVTFIGLPLLLGAALSRVRVCAGKMRGNP